MKNKYISFVLLLAVWIGIMPHSLYAQNTTNVTQLIRESQKALAEKKFEQAEYFSQRAIKLDPAHPPAWRQYGIALWHAGKPEKAVTALQRAVEMDDKDTVAWRGLAQLYQRRGDLADATKALKQALSIEPDHAATQRDLGWILWKQGDRNEALTHLTKAVENGVESRDRVILQVVARLSEEGASDKALKFMHRVDPNKSPSIIALELARSGRVSAAEPILEHAWKSGDKTSGVGLYLAYARAVNGELSELTTYLDPLLQSSTKCSAEYGDMALETLRLASIQLEIPELTVRLEKILEKNDGNSALITDILESSAETQRVHGDKEKALHLYKQVLKRDPDRITWIWVVLLSEHVEGATPFDWIDAHEKRVSDSALLAGVRGIFADRKGDVKEAIDLLQMSLAMNPKQHILREVLFRSLLSQGRIDEARNEIEWFAQQIDSGKEVFRPYLAEMLTQQGDNREALTQWKHLYKANPSSLYYGVETASTLYKLNRSDESISTLQAIVETIPNHRVYELLTEIASARSETTNAVKWAARGIAVTPTQTLLRLHAENLEKLEGNLAAALVSTRAFLKKDPGYVPLTLLEGRILEAMGSTDDVHELHERLLTRNAAFIPSLIALRNSSTQANLLDDAAKYSWLRVELQPDNPEALRDFANSLAQQDNFRKSLNRLRPLTKIQTGQVLPVLVYAAPTQQPYAGRNSVRQISQHIKKLADNGYRFVNTFNYRAEADDDRHVMMILIDPGPAVIEALDPILKKFNARVIYAGNAAFPALTLSGNPIPKNLAPVLASERWKLASGGHPGLRRLSVSTSGVLGNPLTHPLITDKRSETTADFTNRLNKDLSTASRALNEDSERILVYPSGDFGQRSLDTDTKNIAILHDAVDKHFTHAVYFDPYGFYIPSVDTDPLRISARVIPPGWDEEMLLTYLTADHPLPRAWLELARVLYWNGQHEAAHKAFTEAEKAGADPLEIEFNWGMNSDRQGDIPTAQEKLRLAQMLDPESESIRLALARLDDRRRPQATAYLHGWEDNEDRDHYRYGAYGDIFVSDRIRLGAAFDRNRWKTFGLGDEYGTRLGLRGLAYLMSQVWISGSLWQLDMDDTDNHWGGEAMLRVPNPLLSGYLMFAVSRKEIETLEALRADIDASTYSVGTYTRLIDVFDLYADLSHVARSDNNDSLMLNGRLLYRLQDWPYTGIGWRFRFADSDRDPPEYWAPEQLEQHQVHVTVRGAWKRLNGAVIAEAGYARDRDNDWRFVWGARGRGTLSLTDRFDIAADLGWFEGPEYDRLYGRIGVSGQL